MKPHFIIMIVTFLSTLQVYAQTPNQTNFVESNKCGSAKVLKAEPCESAIVEFNFEGCLMKSEPKTATKILCKGNSLQARLGNSQFRYEAQFEKKSDGWGASEWLFKGPLKQWQVSAPRVPAAAPKAATNVPAAPIVNTPVAPPTSVVVPSEAAPTPPAIMPATSPASIPTPAPSVQEATTIKPSLQVSGFFDFRLNAVTVKDQPAWNGASESGYTIDDGKLALSYTEGATEFLADLPFRRAKNMDSDPTLSPADYGSSNSTLLFGTDKAQFFAKHKLSDLFTLWFGQYDTPYGVELNDSKDRVFSKTGLVYDEMLPVTHTGLLLETLFSGNSLKIFSANSNNKGSLGSSSTGDNNYEYGLAWGYSNPSFRVQMGTMNRAINKANGNGRATRTLLDLTLGGTIGWFSVDVELAQLMDPSKNVLTPDLNDSETAGTGFLSLVTLSPLESWAFSFRAESLQKAPSGSSEKLNMNSIGANVKWKISPSFETRLEWITNSYERTNNDGTWSAQRGIISTVISF